MSFTIAIDGPAAAGKGTISKAVAAEFGFAHLDTGLLYRAVGAKVLAGTEAVQAAQNLQSEDFGNADLRTTKVAEAASKVAAIPAVRLALLDFQIEFAARDGGAVLDGRDIGTVICPNADVKLFVTASAEVRADRRFKELSAKGDQTDFQKVLAAVIARDERDAARDVAPMVAAADAITLDTSDMSIENAVAQAISAIRKKYIPS